MEQIKCKICGQSLYKTAEGVYKCSACLSVFKEENEGVNTKKIQDAYELIRSGNFGEAEELCNTVIKENSHYEAYWVKALAKNGVIFVKDIGDKMVPTCQNISADSFAESFDVQKAIELAPSGIAENYKEQAKRIEAIRKEWFDMASKEEPYDVFICFKDSDKENGIERTKDSVYAQDLYNYLQEKGLRVFFSRVSLMGKVSDHYEPYIYNALTTAKVMVVYAQKAEYFSSTWLKNEWSRFISRMQRENMSKNSLIVAYKGVDPYRIPSALLGGRQGIDLSSPSAFNILVEKIVDSVLKAKKVITLERKEIQGGQISKKASKIAQTEIQTRTLGVNTSVKLDISAESKLTIVKNYLSQSMWDEAEDLLNDILEKAPNNGDALVCKLLLRTKNTDWDSLTKINTFTEYELLTSILDNVEAKTARQLLNLFYDRALVNGIETIRLLQCILPYDYADRKNHIENLFDYSIRNANLVLFDILIQTLESYEVEKYIKLNQAMLSTLLGQKAYEAAKVYMDNILSVDAGNVNVLRIACEMVLIEEYSGNENNYTAEEKSKLFIEKFETLLKYVQDIDECVLYFIDKVLEDKIITEDETVLIIQLLKYYKGEIVRLKDKLLFIAGILIKEGLFDEAMYFNNLVLEEDSKCSEAWFNLCLIGTKSKTLEDIVNSDVPLNQCRGYEDYLSLVDNEKQIEMLGIVKKQKPILERKAEEKRKQEEEKRRREEQRLAEEKRRKEEEERRKAQAEAERIRKEKLKKKAKKIAIIGLPILAVVITLLVLTFTLFIPLSKYSEADELFNAGKYDEAMKIYQELDGFSESNQRVTVLSGIEKIDDADFEKGIEKILSAGVPVKLTYGMGGGDFSGTEYVSANGKANTGIALLSTSMPNGIAPLKTSNVSETTEFIYNSSVDFSGIKAPTRSGYRFVEWKLEAYNYQIGGTFELKLNAVWSEKEYTINYNLNGGTVSENNPIEYGIEDDSITLINPTRTGYTFIGWTGTDLDGLSMNVTIDAGSVGNRSYEANWQANTYTITLLPNGGTTSNSTITVTYDQPYTLPNAEWDGHTFSGWFDGNESVIDGTWTNTSDLELTAKWDIITYDITYDLNNGTNDSSNPFAYTIDDEVTLAQPSKVGYTFIGWTGTDLDGLTMDVTINTGSIGNRSYEANWQANTYTITLLPNGGTTSNSTITVTYDQAYTLPNASWEGHTFSGWFDGNKKVTSGTWTNTSDLELTAKWNIVTYNISYILNSGINASSNPSTYTVDDEVTLAQPSREGYIFEGWTFSGQTTPVLNVTISAGTIGNKEYSANWQADTYTLTFDTDGGNVSSESKNVTYDSSFTLPTPSKSGYTFVGWYNGTKQYTAGTWKTASDVTLKAKWNANKYTVKYDDTTEKRANINVTFNYNYSGSTPTTVTLSNTQKLNAPNNPTRTGYIFTGWYTTSACTTKYNFTGSITSDMTLYAGWDNCTVSNSTSYPWSSSNGVLTSTNKGANTSSTYTITAKMPVKIEFYYMTSSEKNYDELIVKKNDTVVLECSGTTSYVLCSVNLLAGEKLTFTYSKDGSQSSGSDCASIKDLTYTSNVSVTSTATASCSTVTGYEYDTTKETSVTVTFGSSHTLPTLTRTGYSFLGWFNGDTKVDSGNWNIASNVTLAPKWEAGGNTIALVGNGGNVSPSSVPVKYDQPYTLPTPSRTGYTFAGWYNGTTRVEDGTWTGLSDITLVANWNANNYTVTYDDVVKSKTYAIVTFNYNGTGATSTTATLTNGQILNRPSNPTRSGYVFTGWYTTAACTTRYDFSGTITDDMTLYAGWEELSMSNVYEETQINPYDYTSSSYAYSTSTSWTSSSYKKHIYMVAEETGTHYIYFKNSTTSSSYKYYLQIYNLTTETTIKSNATVSSTSYTYQSFTCSKGDVIVISLYRYSTSYSEYYSTAYFYFSGFGIPATSTAKAELSTNEYEYKNDSTYSESVKFDENYTLPTPVRTGYAFDGWYCGETKVENSKWNYANDVTLTAKWTPNSYTITYDVNGGECDTVTQEVIYDDDYTVPTPTRTGYTFGGWYNGDIEYVGGIWTELADITLVAKWDIIEYTISYTMNDGTNASSNPTSYTVEDSFTLQSPTRTGYIFLGWTFEGQVTPTQNVTISANTGNLAYTANWQADSYTITYDVNGGECDTLTDNVIFDEDYTVPTPTRTGYTFGGWYNGDIEYVGGTWQTASDITLVAKWTPRTDISYVVNHYQENIDDDNFTLVKTEDLLGTADELISPDVEVYDGFTSPVVKEVTVNPGGSLVVDYYYTRNIYSITFVTNGGETIDALELKYQQEVNLPNAIRENFTFGGWFTDANLTNAFEEIAMPSSDITVYAWWQEETKAGEFTFENGQIVDCNSTSATVTIPMHINGEMVIAIGNNAFERNNYIEKVVVPNTITSIGSNVFSNCLVLEELVIPSSVTTIGSNTFDNCVSLSRINSEIDGQINLPSNLAVISSYLFNKCLSIKEVNIGKVTTIQSYAFSDCTNITKFNSTTDKELIIPNGVTAISEYAFQNLSLIEKIVVSDTVELIENGSFKGCNSLVDITLPFIGKTIDSGDKHESHYSSVGNHTVGGVGSTSGSQGVLGYIFGVETTSGSGKIFQYNCSSQSVVNGVQHNSNTNYYYHIPRTIRKVTITRDTTIMYGAFKNCSFIQDVILPINVQNIITGAFDNCGATISKTYIPSIDVPWDGSVATKFASGDGTQENPYLIQNASQFAYFAKQVNAGVSYESKHIRLEINLDMNKKAFSVIGSDANQFKGTFDGNGHFIKNISISSANSYVGLFAYNCGTIENLAIENITVNASKNVNNVIVGGLVAYNMGEISNCYLTGLVKGSCDSILVIGGMIGENNGTIKNCYTTANVEGTSVYFRAYAGGFIGKNSESGVCEDCFASGNVTSKGASEIFSFVGGFVSENEGTITNCYRFNEQVLIAFSTGNINNHCEEGSEASLSDIITYCQNNWSNEIWNFDDTMPKLQK